MIRFYNSPASGVNITEIYDYRLFGEALNRGGFHLVITGYQLRWTNGLDVLKTIKASYPQCPTLMFTNTGNEEIAVEAMKSGLDDYIIKSPKHYVPFALRFAQCSIELPPGNESPDWKIHLILC
ncbi:response regulator [Microcoleus sp.]|uniref:response regulator n=1 Tax=Microcoleus sp. TaxID=44472 RepID=UPI00403E7640